MDWILSSNRLNFRRLSRDDFTEVAAILQDADVMYAWEHAFTDDEVYAWIDKNLERYENDGFSYFAMIEKRSGKLIGVMGPLIEEIEGERQVGLAYILGKSYWRSGFAIEGARACMDYAFKSLVADKVIAEIRPENLSSRRVAEKLGMNIEGEFLKHYNGADMPHLIYSRHK